MKTRVTISVLMLLLLSFAAVLATDEVTEVKKPEAVADSAKVEKTTASDTKVIAYYVHGTRRCATCKKLEAYTQEAIETGFAEQLKAGSIEWMPVNTDEEGNGHFIDDYKLFTKSVVLSEVKDGKELRWKNLDKIWTLVRGDKEAYLKYIQDEVTAFIGKS